MTNIGEHGNARQCCVGDRYVRHMGTDRSIEQTNYIRRVALAWNFYVVCSMLECSLHSHYSKRVQYRIHRDLFSYGRCTHLIRVHFANKKYSIRISSSPPKQLKYKKMLNQLSSMTKFSIFFFPTNHDNSFNFFRFYSRFFVIQN